jgi:hypothetical protein
MTHFPFCNTAKPHPTIFHAFTQQIRMSSPKSDLYLRKHNKKEEIINFKKWPNTVLQSVQLKKRDNRKARPQNGRAFAFNHTTNKATPAQEPDRDPRSRPKSFIQHILNQIGGGGGITW